MSDTASEQSKRDLQLVRKARSEALVTIKALEQRLLTARREALEEAARIADRGMLYGTDGGSPTEDETAVAKDIATAIRNLMETEDV